MCGGWLSRFPQNNEENCHTHTQGAVSQGSHLQLWPMQKDLYWKEFFGEAHWLSPPLPLQDVQCPSQSERYEKAYQEPPCKQSEGKIHCQIVLFLSGSELWWRLPEKRKSEVKKWNSENFLWTCSKPTWNWAQRHECRHFGKWISQNECYWQLPDALWKFGCIESLWEGSWQCIILWICVKYPQTIPCSIGKIEWMLEIVLSSRAPDFLIWFGSNLYVLFDRKYTPQRSRHTKDWLKPICAWVSQVTVTWLSEFEVQFGQKPLQGSLVSRVVFCSCLTKLAIFMAILRVFGR